MLNDISIKNITTVSSVIFVKIDRNTNSAIKESENFSFSFFRFDNITIYQNDQISDLSVFQLVSFF